MEGGKETPIKRAAERKKERGRAGEVATLDGSFVNP